MPHILTPVPCDVVTLYRSADGSGTMDGCPHVVRHSPSGLDWDDHEGGAADCALSILMHYVGEPYASKLYQEFKTFVIGCVPVGGVVLTRAYVQEWVQQRIPAPWYPVAPGG